MAERMERRFMAHFIDTTFGGSSPSWYRIGKDLSEFSVELNPQITRETNMLGDGFVYVDGYEPEADAEPFYARVGDALFSKLQRIVDGPLAGESCRTYMLEVHLWDVPSGSPGTIFTATRRECYVTPTSYGGDSTGYQVPFSITYVANSAVTGVFEPNGHGGGAFTPD